MLQGEAERPLDADPLGVWRFRGIPGSGRSKAAVDVSYRYDEDGVVEVSASLDGVPPAPPEIDRDERDLSWTDEDPASASRGEVVVALVIDVSTSMQGAKLGEAKTACLAFVEELEEARGAERVALVSFGSSAQTIVAMGGGARKARAAVKRLATAGSTNLAAGLQCAHGELSGQDGRRVVVVLTDGAPDDRAAAMAVREQLLADGVELIARGVGWGGRGVPRAARDRRRPARRRGRARRQLPRDRAPAGRRRAGEEGMSGATNPTGEGTFMDDLIVFLIGAFVFAIVATLALFAAAAVLAGAGVVTSAWAFGAGLAAFSGDFRASVLTRGGQRRTPRDPEPAFELYVLGQLFADFRHALEDAAGVLGATRGQIGGWSAKYQKGATWPLAIGAIVGGYFGTVFAGVLGVVCGVLVAVLVVALAGVSWLLIALLRVADAVRRRVRHASYECPTDHERFALPIYVCPACGAEHRRLVPGRWGIFRRECRCGQTALPTTVIGGRQRVPQRCPSGHPMSGLSRLCENLPIAIVGGPSAGSRRSWPAHWSSWSA